VIWDTTLARETEDETLMDFGTNWATSSATHLEGHDFPGCDGAGVLYLVYRCIGWLWRAGAGWGIHALDDWASLPR